MVFYNSSVVEYIIAEGPRLLGELRLEARRAEDERTAELVVGRRETGLGERGGVGSGKFSFLPHTLCAARRRGE